MEEVEFLVHEEFEQPLADRFNNFIAGLSKPCVISIDITSCGGYTEVLKQMGALIDAKKSEGYVVKTNVNDYAYSCGMLLFLMGDVKTASLEARFLFHSSGFDVFDRLTSTDLRAMLEMLEEDDAFIEKVLSENTTLDAGMYEILKKNDNFLSRQDLIFLGFMEDEYELI
jgi:ATP-dependent protease ClpP protease subunit